MKYGLLLFLLCGICHTLLAQQEAWIYFSDKENVEAALRNPITILSQPALDRKIAHGIKIDFRDVPVNESYISLLKSSIGIVVMAKSKWMNAVHVRGERSAIAVLDEYDFVQHIDFADKSLNGAARSTVLQGKFEKEHQLEGVNYGKAQNQVEMIHVDALHQGGFTGEGVIIAVIDGGFPNVNSMKAFQRLRDNNRLLGGYDFVDRTAEIYNFKSNSHGTRVLSTMAGYLEDAYVGTAPGAAYYLFRTEIDDVENPVEESLWVEAVERADSLGVHIINSSLGYNTFDEARYDYVPAQMDGKITFISKGATIASEKGLLVVNSAGNSGNDFWGGVIAPADVPSVLTVGAVNQKGFYAAFSSKGSVAQPSQKPDVVALGLGSQVINEYDEVVNNNGTSFSSPILAGGMACLWQALPNATAAELIQYIRASASQYAAPDDRLGYGIPDFEFALSQALALSLEREQEFKVFPNPVSQKLSIQRKHNLEDQMAHIYDMMGKQVGKSQRLDAASTIDVSGLSAGMYVLSVLSNNSSFNFKFVKI